MSTELIKKFEESENFIIKNIFYDNNGTKRKFESVSKNRNYYFPLVHKKNLEITELFYGIKDRQILRILYTFKYKSLRFEIYSLRSIGFIFINHIVSYNPIEKMKLYSHVLGKNYVRN